MAHLESLLNKKVTDHPDDVLLGGNSHTQRDEKQQWWRARVMAELAKAVLGEESSTSTQL